MNPVQWLETSEVRKKHKNSQIARTDQFLHSDVNVCQCSGVIWKIPIPWKCLCPNRSLDRWYSGSFPVQFLSFENTLLQYLVTLLTINIINVFDHIRTSWHQPKTFIFKCSTHNCLNLSKCSTTTFLFLMSWPWSRWVENRETG